MMYLKWLILALITIVVMVIQFTFGWYIALFVKKDGTYPWLFKWAQPYDTLAIGDTLFWNREMDYCMTWPWWLRNYWLALNWSCWRNPGYGMMGYFGFKVSSAAWYTTDKDVDIGDHGYTLGTSFRLASNNGTNYFNYKRAGAWSESLGWMVEFGWVIKGIENREVGDICRLCIDVRPFIKLQKD